MTPKAARQRAIMRLVREHRVSSQEALRDLLVRDGFDVTQATVSRDVRELRLVKTPEPGGSARYHPPDSSDHAPDLHQLLPTLFRSAEGAGQLLVVRTLTGSAQALALAIDGEEWPEVLGTIGGDDTILVICRSAAAVKAVRDRIRAGARPSRRRATTGGGP